MDLMTMVSIFKWYIIVDLAFLITSLFTLHFPSWRIAKAWAKEYLEESRRPTKKFIATHTIAYSLVAFIAFPVLFVVVLLNNKAAVTGYTKSLIKELNEKT